MRTKTFIGTAALVATGLAAIAATAPASGPAEQLSIVSEATGGDLSVGAEIGDTGHRAELHTDGTLTVTTQGTEGCPVLLLTITDDQGRAAISLGQVPTSISCGTTPELFTTIIELPPGSQNDLPLFCIDGQTHEVETRTTLPWVS